MRRDDFDLEIDRALSGERFVPVSPDFAARVMRSVRHEFDEQQGIAFPWWRFSVGLGTSVALIVAGVLTAAPQGAPDAELVAAAQWLPTSLSVSFALAWWFTRARD